MNFRSDNEAPVAPEILHALCNANGGDAPSYGADRWSLALDEAFSECFETPVHVLPLVSGTAGNVIALSQVCPPYGAVFCHDEAHVLVDECGAFEFYSGGAKLIPLAGDHAKLAAATLEDRLGWFGVKGDHEPIPAAVSITQGTEYGAVYRPDEIAAISTVCRAHGMRLHMDGARFANALVSLGVAPADLTWRAGVDLMTLGFTKNGALAAEAVVLFDTDLVAGLSRRRMKGGHLLSKMRYVSSQLLACIEHGRWLDFAGRANAGAARLGRCLATSSEAALAHPVEINEVFVRLDDALDRRLRDAGFDYYPWPGTEGVSRLVVPWNVADEDLRAFEAVVSGA
ncbi:MAG: beta-eliminating lyase-related protein [Pseudomonadota bacterium]